MADYIGRTHLNESQRDALRALVEAARAMQPTIVGWMEESPDRHVWSTGDAAKQTILAAVEDLRKQDLFWAPGVQAVEVYAPSR